MQKSELQNLGLSLRQIRPDLLKKTEVALQESFWYQGGEKYFDLFLDFSDGALIKLFLSFRGQFLEWHLDQSLKTGTTNEMQSDHGPSPKSKLIQVDPNVNWEFVEFVRAILAFRQEDSILVQAFRVLPDRGGG